MAKIFEETSLAGVSLKNRIFRSPVFEGLCGENYGPHQRHTDIYTRVARGQAGAIVTGIISMRQDGKAFPKMPLLDNDAVIPAFAKMTDAVHKQGAPIFAQIMHAGRQTDTKTTGVKPVAPSAIRDRAFIWDKPRALSDSEVSLLVDGFVSAVVRAKQAGFDGVELHGAHGYMLSQFLSPYMNRRKDQWGGSTENRCRILVQILEKARKEVKDFPLLVRFNAHDNRGGGMRPDEAVRIAKILESAGADALDISCGVFEDGFNTIRVSKMPVGAMLEKVPQLQIIPGFLKPLAKRGLPLMFQTPRPVLNYNMDAAKLIKSQVSVPVMVVGGIRRLADMEKALDEGVADYIALGRPFLREPDIVEKLQSGKTKKSACINCGQCLAEMAAGETRCAFA